MTFEKNCLLRYCPHLGRNVIMEATHGPSGRRLECLSKSDCGFFEEGCRNLLVVGERKGREERVGRGRGEAE